MSTAFPNSFSLSGDGTVILQEGQRFSAPETSVSGGGAVGGPQIGGVSARQSNLAGIAANSMKAITALDNLTNGALKGYVEQVEKTQYHEGMTKVVQGQTLQQVKDSDPWYMNILGPSATVRGAQAMTATTAIQQAETDMMLSMQDDRALSPDQYRAKLREKYLALGNTGDPMVDMVAQSKFAEANAALARTQTREHMAYQQEQGFQRYTNMNISIGDSMKARRSASTQTGMDPKEREQMAREAVEGFMPLPGMSRDSWNRASVQALGAALQRGNFDYYEAIKHSPAWNQLDVKAREAIDANYDNAVLAYAQRSPLVTDLTNSIAAFEFNSGRGTTGITGAEDFHKFLDQYNERHQTMTGSQEPLINNTRRASMLKQWATGREQFAARLAAANDSKAEKDAHARSTGNAVMDAFTTGNFAALKGLTLDNAAAAAVLNVNFDQEYGDATDPDRQQRFMERAAAVSFNDNLRVPRLEQLLRVGVTGLLNGGGAITPTQKQAYEAAQRLFSATNGEQALANYIGAADAAKVTGLINSGVSMDDPKAMLEQLTRIQRGGLPFAGAAEREAIVGIVQDADPGWFRGMLPWTDSTLSPFSLTDESKAALGQQIAGHAAQYVRAYNVSLEQGAKIAMTEALKNADVIGGTVITRTKNSSTDVSLVSAVNRLLPGAGQQHTSSYQQAARNVIGNSLRAEVEKHSGDMSNFDPDDYQVSTGAQLGNGMLHIMLLPKDAGRAAKTGIVTVMLTPQAMADEIKRIESEAANRKVRDDRAATRQKGDTYGLAINPDGLNLRPAIWSADK